MVSFHITRTIPSSFQFCLQGPLKKALGTLTSNESIIIKPTDKTFGLAIMTKDWYKGETLCQLQHQNVYCLVLSIPWEVIFGNLSKLLINAFFSKCITLQEKEFLLHHPPKGFQAYLFYLIPKVHKPNLCGHPICSYNANVFEHASK